MLRKENILNLIAWNQFFPYKLVVTAFAIMLQVETFFARLIQRVSPKSFAQALGEVTVTQKFLENFSGDQVWEALFVIIHAMLEL